jgi:hypothetical protein
MTAFGEVVEKRLVVEVVVWFVRDAETDHGAILPRSDR